MPLAGTLDETFMTNGITSSNKTLPVSKLVVNCIFSSAATGGGVGVTGAGASGFEQEIIKTKSAPENSSFILLG